ncbi:membrane or secreted protein [Pedobacter frigoris]|uniref:Membrane or secreted protein n=1 Tax=Pedobacter frigoris TaxID=2571272 RepID=A0A4U1CDP3_9SPHI|nr:membrane or secreted protein [Pedobacter frigoris]TKC05088.1 membrane or secreted protein [Pedobacter frigoris]
MKVIKLIIPTVVIVIATIFSLHAQSISGAWHLSEGNKSHHLFFQDGFYFHTVHEGNKFLTSEGGKYTINDKTLKAESLFNSNDSTKIGTMLSIPFSISADQLSLQVEEGNVEFDRVDNGTAPLAGVWRITGRMQDGKISPIHQTGTRQTYKLLTGTKFQWVAIDPAKKQFSGTGGGSYTFKDGKYTENIEFFSRDNTRVGASLSFDGKLENGDWHHSGLSSKGDKIYEIWSRVK